MLYLLFLIWFQFELKIHKKYLTHRHNTRKWFGNFPQERRQRILRHQSDFRRDCHSCSQINIIRPVHIFSGNVPVIYAARQLCQCKQTIFTARKNLSVFHIMPFRFRFKSVTSRRQTKLSIRCCATSTMATKECRPKTHCTYFRHHVSMASPITDCKPFANTIWSTTFTMTMCCKYWRRPTKWMCPTLKTMRCAWLCAIFRKWHDCQKWKC